MADRDRRSRLALAGLGGRTVAILVVIILGIAAATRFDQSLDLSPDRRYTLDADLVRVLDAQQEPIRLVAIWPRDGGDILEAIEDALRRMAGRNEAISVERIDPDLQIPLVEQHRKRYGDATSPAVYVCKGDRAFKIPVTRSTRRVLQREVGGGILALAEAKPPTARFLTGHGELAPGGGMSGSDALIRAYELAGLRTSVGGSEPIDPASLLVLLGPTAPLGTTTIAAIDQHLVDGGALQVFADDQCPLDLALLLRRYGILLGPAIPKALLSEGDWRTLLRDDGDMAPPAVVVSRTRHEILQEAEFPYGNLSLSGDLMAPHPALGGLDEANRTILSPWTTPVFLGIDPGLPQEALQALAEAGRLPTFAEPPARLLISAPGDSWMTLRREPPKVPADLDEHPPLPLALATVYAPDTRSARQGEQARIVVWGSRAAISNGVLALEQFANAEAAVAMARWALNRGKANPIPASETAAFRVETTDEGLWIITALLVALVPCLAIGGAMLAWLHRR